MTVAVDSSTGGYLLPQDVAPLADEPLAVAMQQIVSGITGIPGNLVRVRWQPIPPKQPEYSVDWCSVGVTTVESDTMDAQLHVAATLSSLPSPIGDGLPVAAGAVGGSIVGSSFELNGYTQAVENERMRVVASFIGPNANGYARMFRAGLKMGQNRDALFAINAGLMYIGNCTWFPELVNNQWIPRMDIDFIVSRSITRLYAIDAVQSAEVRIVSTFSAGTVITTD